MEILTANKTSQQKDQAVKKHKYAAFSVVLFLIILALGSLAFIFSMRNIQYINAGRALSQTIKNEKLRLEATVNGEIALVLKMADSPLVQRYFLNPGDAELEILVFEELAGYRRVFLPKSIFWVNDIDKRFYFNGSYSYTVDPDESGSYWYYQTLNETERFNLNINYDTTLDETNFWINAPVFDSGRGPIGVLGTGIDVSAFVDSVFRDYSGDARLFYFNNSGEITGADDRHIVASKTSLESELGKAGSAIFSRIENLEDDEAQYFNTIEGIAALVAIPEFGWYVCAILPVSLKDMLNSSMTVLFAVMMSVVTGIIIIFNLRLSNFEMVKEIAQKTDELASLSHWYKSILDAAPFPITVTDTDMNWIFANNAVKGFLGFNPEDMLGKPCSNWNTHICNTSDCGIARAKRGINRTFFAHNGASYQVDVTIMKGLNDEVAGFIEVVQDITKLKAEEEKALAASRAKSNFLGAMSHEMRTPMNAIIGMAAIGKSTADTGRKNDALTKIEDASRHLLGIINDVLDMSEIEANKLELSPAVFDLRRSLPKAVSLVQFNIDEKQLEFSMKMGDDTPSFLIGDEQRLLQVIMNLLSNAVKFTPKEGKISLGVSLAGEEDGMCELRFEVADTGIGISSEYQGKLFQAFEQAESGTTRRFGGTGLGLVVSKYIVQLMDGRIWVESELGKGSRFIFTVKLSREVKDSLPQSGSDNRNEVSLESIQGRFKGKKLLVVDDIEINREILVSILDDTGLIIDTAENGKEAFDKVKEAPDKYDLVFMDMQMPLMDGLEAARQIRALPGIGNKKLPIIAMTANVFQDEIEKCYEAGMDDHIGKPLDVDLVFEKLREYLT